MLAGGCAEEEKYHSVLAGRYTVLAGRRAEEEKCHAVLAGCHTVLAGRHATEEKCHAVFHRYRLGKNKQSISS